MPVYENMMPEDENPPVEENRGMFWSMIAFWHFIFSRNALAANHSETQSGENSQNDTNESEDIGLEEFFTPRRNEGFY